MKKTLMLVALVTTVVMFAATNVGAHGEHISTEVEGTFSTTCGQVRASHHSADDPIVFPGQPGAAHLHEFFGNNTTNAFSTRASMLAGTTDCHFKPDTAGYWVPAMQSASGATIIAYNHWIYVRDFRGYPVRWGQELRAFPADLKIITDRHYWRCRVNGVRTDSPTIIPRCDSGSAMTFEASFPQCWDGVRLDSADHRSHMTHQTVTRSDGLTYCPATHPVRVPGLSVFGQFLETDHTGWHLSSDHGAPPGSSMHADFWNTWNQSQLERITQICLIDHGDIPESPNYTDANGTAYDPSCLQADSKFVTSPTPTPTPTSTSTPTPTVTPTPTPTPTVSPFCQRHPWHRKCQ